jgi:capsular polysaccharide biosynthesis protein
VKALKEKIAAFEKLIGKANNTTSKVDNTTSKVDNTIAEVGIDALERQRISAKMDLAGISQKLAVARLGESLERGQHSERLSVIEQPTLPQKPIRPNRPKILAVVFAMAIAAGGGLVLALEMFDGTIRRNADLAKLVDSQLIVSIPYISTKAEALRQKSRKITLAIGSSVIVVLVGLGAAIYLLRMFGLF